MQRSLFSSPREKRLWLMALLLVVTIYATLARAPEIAARLRSQDLAALLFGTGLLLTIVAILAHGLTRRPSSAWIALSIGIAAVYIVTFARIQVLEERSHLMEYSVVALFIYQALLERQSNAQQVPRPALLAILITIALGWLDEGIQAFLPNRHFAWQDVFFNTLAAFMSVSASAGLNWARQRKGNSA